MSEQTKVFFKDLHEHVSQIIESIEINREMIWGLMGMHMTLISNKMNEVMKVLTVFASIFIPLSFIAGIYGMNFAHMPELGWKWGYPGVLLLMLGISVGLLAFFRKKRWKTASFEPTVEEMHSPGSTCTPKRRSIHSEHSEAIRRRMAWAMWAQATASSVVPRVSGSPKKIMIPSPMNLSMVPPQPSAIADISPK